MGASQRWAVCATVVMLSLLQARSAAAQRSIAMLDMSGDFATPITSPALDRYHPGGGLTAAALFRAYPFLLPALRARANWFGDGPAPADSRLADPGAGSLYALTAGVRLRPGGFSQSGPEPSATGFWAEIDLGVALTGLLVRPAFECGIGWAFAVGSMQDTGQIDVGPVVRFTHVVQTDERSLDGNSAYVLSLGVEVVVFDAAPQPEEVAQRAAERERREREQMDSDADGIDDADDACPYVAEDVDGWRDQDGCPDLDDDQDGVPDTVDQCPREPEDPDGWQDEDGCPDLDNDGDAIADAVDRCPNEAETVNGNDDEDGCPDEGLFELTNDHIVLAESVLFDLNLARVRHAARPILAAVANLIRQHPEWAHLRIEGHADQQGEEAWNVELSRRRALQVRRVLIELGVPAALLVSEGFGSSQPRVPGDSDDAYRANRRVEIVVVEQSTEGRSP